MVPSSESTGDVCSRGVFCFSVLSYDLKTFLFISGHFKMVSKGQMHFTLHYFTWKSKNMNQLRVSNRTDAGADIRHTE